MKDSVVGVHTHLVFFFPAMSSDILKYCCYLTYSFSKLMPLRKRPVDSLAFFENMTVDILEAPQSLIKASLHD